MHHRCNPFQFLFSLNFSFVLCSPFFASLPISVVTYVNTVNTIGSVEMYYKYREIENTAKLK